ncbi:hypothetical protein ACEPAF_7662 [Sanghuangporus sanghuang]
MDEAVKRLKEVTLTTMADVVKKPKLDTHSYKCHASFTCVDCSKTFWIRSEWKGHISCISEAEKYQKALYKGKKTQQNGPASLGADKSESSGTKGPNKSITVQSKSTSGNGVESIRRDTSDTVVNNGNPATMMPGPAADMQAKEASKKKKRRADGSHLAPTDDASTGDSKKKRKKRKLDAADTNEQTETAQDDASKTAVSSSPDMTPQVPETKTLEKEKKDKKDKKRWKDKKDKEKPVSDVGKEHPIAPSATDPQPSASDDRQKSDNPPSKKKFKKKDTKSNPSEKVSEGPVPAPTDEAGTQAAVKKKKSKREHKDGTSSNVKKDDGVAPDRKCKQPDETGDDDAVSAKKAKKERKKERKRKARNDAQPDENP